MKKNKTIIALLAILLATIMIGCFKKVYAETEVTLKSFELMTTELTQGEKINYQIEYEGDIKFIGIWAKEKTSGEVFYTSTDTLEDNYFDLSKPNGNTSGGHGTFQMIGLTLGLDSGIKYYSTDCNNDSCNKYDFSNYVFTIKEKKEEDLPIYDYVMSYKTEKAAAGERIYVNFGSPESFNGVPIVPKQLVSVMLHIEEVNNPDNSINVYLRGLGSEPYFIIPSTSKVGSYHVTYGYLTFVDGTSEIYRETNNKAFSYGGFEVIEKTIDKSKYLFNNENYNVKMQEDLKELNNNAVITINASNFPIIDKAIFETIQNTNRTLIIEYNQSTWVFNGKDIDDPKTIEVSTYLEDLQTSINSDDFLKSKVGSRSVILKFSANGELPGKVLIRLNSREVEAYTGNAPLNAYYYDETASKLNKVAVDIQKHDDFYEFYIGHNSIYIITADEISKEVISNNSKDLDLNSGIINLTPKGSILIIAMPILLVVIILILAITTRNKPSKDNQ